VLRLFADAIAEAAGGDDGAGVSGYMAENRRGELVFQAPPTLSIGVVSIRPGEYESHREVATAASAAKKQAKKAGKAQGDGARGAVFVERRRPHLHAFSSGGESTAIRMLN